MQEAAEKIIKEAIEIAMNRASQHDSNVVEVDVMSVVREIPEERSRE